MKEPSGALQSGFYFRQFVLDALNIGRAHAEKVILRLTHLLQPGVRQRVRTELFFQDDILTFYANIQ